MIQSIPRILEQKEGGDILCLGISQGLPLLQRNGFHQSFPKRNGQASNDFL